MAKGVKKPSSRVGLLCWINWKVKENHSTGQTCWPSSWKWIYLMLGVFPRINKKSYSCMHTCSMQSVLINSFLAWASHGHLQKKLWTYIASFFHISANDESWLEYVTHPPYIMIFEQDPPYMSQAVMEVFLNMANWYVSPEGTFTKMYSMDKALHVLLRFSMDKLVM